MKSFIFSNRTTYFTTSTYEGQICNSNINDINIIVCIIEDIITTKACPSYSSFDFKVFGIYMNAVITAGIKGITPSPRSIIRTIIMLLLNSISLSYIYIKMRNGETIDRAEIKNAEKCDSFIFFRNSISKMFIT